MLARKYFNVLTIVLHRDFSVTVFRSEDCQEPGPSDQVSRAAQLPDLIADPIQAGNSTTVPYLAAGQNFKPSINFAASTIGLSAEEW
jgi:hypothetical protein